MITVSHNMMAMNAYRQFGLVNNAKAKSTERLSSGYRINRAADDAAGLAISEKMRRQIRGLSQASFNAQDGISMVQTAEGATAEVHDMLHRITELTVKAANGTVSLEDREYIQKEISEIVGEIDRVSETTTFNEHALLAGDKDKYKEVPLWPHSAGIAGHMTDNGDGTATFDIGELHEGDIFTYGGTNYKLTDDFGSASVSIGDNTPSDVYLEIGDAEFVGVSHKVSGIDVNNAKDILKNVFYNLDNAGLSNYDRIRIGDKEYRHWNGIWENTSGQRVDFDRITSTLKAGDNISVLRENDGYYWKNYTVGGEVNSYQSLDQAKAIIKNAFEDGDQAGFSNFDRIRIGDKEYHCNNGKWENPNGQTVDFTHITSTLKAGDSFSILRDNDGYVWRNYTVGGRTTTRPTVDQAKAIIKNAFEDGDQAGFSYYDRIRIGDKEYHYNNGKWENPNGQTVDFAHITSTLKAGDSFSILRDNDGYVWRNYTIGGRVSTMPTLAEAKSIIKNVFEDGDQAGFSNYDRIGIGDKEYHYYNGNWQNQIGQTVDFAHITSTLKAGDNFSILRDNDGFTWRYYTVAGQVAGNPSVDQAKAIIKNAFEDGDQAGFSNYDRIGIGDKEYHYYNGNWQNTMGQTVDFDSITSSLKEGDAFDIFRGFDGNVWRNYLVGSGSVASDPNRQGKPISSADLMNMIAQDLLDANNIGATAHQAGVASEGTNGVFTIMLGTVRVPREKNYDLMVGVEPEEANKIRVTIESMGSTNLGIHGLDVVDETGRKARFTIDAVKDAVKRVSGQRARLGAKQNRIDHTIKNLDNVVENTQAAESKIRDTDMAKEMVQNSIQNILSQAGISMMSQANQANAGVMSMLQ